MTATRAEVSGHNVVTGHGIATLTRNRSSTISGLKNSHGQDNEQKEKVKARMATSIADKGHAPRNARVSIRFR